MRLPLHRIVVDQAFPLELKVAEVDEMVSTRAARFASADEMFADRPSGTVYLPGGGAHAQLFD